jgi:hypothetical protein
MSKARQLRLLNADQLAAPTPSTVAEYRDALELLAAQLERVRRMTERYPVYLVLAGASYKFDGPSDVDRFISRLRKEISAFESAKSGRMQVAAAAL